MDSVLIRYHEIALKKGNRAYFTEMLKRNILAAVKDFGAKEIRSLPARLLLTFKNEVAADITSNAFQCVRYCQFFYCPSAPSAISTICAAESSPRSTAANSSLPYRHPAWR